MGKYIVLVAILLILLVGCGEALAGKGYADWNYDQKQSYWGCIKEQCTDLLKDNQYKEWRSCALNCFSQADDFVPPVEELFCEDTDEGIDYKNFGTITDNKNPNGKDDYCYESNGINYVFEGHCIDNAYRRYNKDCKDYGQTWDCVEGACVNQVCEVAEVDNGVVSAYPGCELSCNEGYDLEDGVCVEWVCEDTDGDGVCNVDEILGCTDETALNYNPEATEEDNTCEFNNAPVLAAIGDQETGISQELTIELSATDEDGDDLEYYLATVPEGADLNNNIFTWTPTEDQIGENEVMFIVSDGMDSDSETITITVKPEPICVIPTDGMSITEDTWFCSGTYYLGATINIKANDITLDCQNAKLYGNNLIVAIYQKSKNGVTIKNCNFDKFKKGIWLYYSKNNKIINNNFKSMGKHGLYLNWRCNNNEIRDNTFETANYGLELGGRSDNNLMFDNLFDHGLFTIGSESSGNKIYHNNFINGVQVKDHNQNTWNLNQEGNYWYSFDSEEEFCFDNDKNGICDNAYSGIISYQENKKSYDFFPFTQPNGWE
jgi:parallel beta-helix repeat protein